MGGAGSEGDLGRFWCRLGVSYYVQQPMHDDHYFGERSATEPSSIVNVNIGLGNPPY